MSWKMFWQIVLLIVIAALVSSAVKYGGLRGRRSWMGKDMPEKMMKK